MRTLTLSTVPTKYKNISAVLLIVLTFFMLVWFVYTYLPVHENANPPLTWGFSVDWKGCIRPDTLKLISGHSPYAEGCGLNPPWTYLLLAPIALLPPDLGAAVIFVITYFVYTLVLFRRGAKPLMIAAGALCAFVFVNAKNGNIDWMPVLGFILPPQIGLFFLLIKPQIGAALALFWLVESWRIGKLREVIRVFAPVTFAMLISFAIYGFYPLKLTKMPNDPYNSSLWPFGLLIGIPLLFQAIRSRKDHYAIGAAPFLAPYVNIHSYAILLFTFLPYEVGYYLFIALSWLVMR